MKTLIALSTALVLTTAFASVSQAQSARGLTNPSATSVVPGYPTPRHCISGDEDTRSGYPSWQWC